MLGVLFFLPAMNLGGIPPLPGFLGKIGLLEAGAEAGGFLPYLLIGGSVTTSLLTLYAMAKVWNRAFWRPLSAEPDALEMVVGEEDSGATVAQRTAKQTITPRRAPSLRRRGGPAGGRRASARIRLRCEREIRQTRS